MWQALSTCTLIIIGIIFLLVGWLLCKYMYCTLSFIVCVHVHACCVLQAMPWLEPLPARAVSGLQSGARCAACGGAGRQHCGAGRECAGAGGQQCGRAVCHHLRRLQTPPASPGRHQQGVLESPINLVTVSLRHRHM